MKTNILIGLSMILLCGNAIAANNYIIDNDIVYIDDSKVYLSATPHTLSSSGWVYFNLTSKVYTGNIDTCWGFNTSISKPTKAELYKPHWVNTTTNHEKTFYNFSFIVYTGGDLDYGNSYNTNYKYTITEPTVNENGTTYTTSNAAFDSFDTDGTNYTIYWYTRHDNHYLWKDFSSSFNSVIYNYEGFNKWYYIKNIPIISNKKYTVRTWIDVPISTEKQSGKYYFAIKPSGETISQAVNNGHFYNLDPWWNAAWSTRKEIILTGNTSGAQIDYQILLNVSYDSEMQSNFNDLRFCNDTDEIDSWLEFKIDSFYALVWVEFPTTPANGLTQTYYMYYGNDAAASDWDGMATFPFFDGWADLNAWNTGLGSPSVSGGELTLNNAGIYHAITFPPAYSVRMRGKSVLLAGDHSRFYLGSDYAAVNAGPYIGWVENTDISAYYSTAWHRADEWVADVYQVVEMQNVDNTAYTFDIFVDDVERITGAGFRNDQAMDNIILYNNDVYDFISDWIFVRKYAANPPTYEYEFGSEGYYAGSIHYNNTNPYNNTIDSNGAISVNQSIIPTDNIEWTASALTNDCHLVVTKYDLSDIIIANFTIYTASLDWLTVPCLSLYTYYNLLFANGTLIESQITDDTGIVYFTTNLTMGSYIIEKGVEIDPFRENAYCFYDEMKIGLTDFRDGMGKYLVWGILFSAVGLAFTLFTKIKQTLIGGK